MKISDHDLQQLNPDWLRARTPEELLHVSQNLLDDLKEARERLNQNSTNSSVVTVQSPPQHFAPLALWERVRVKQAGD
jgi:hypothetical protein